jgi:hypothetical protein
MLSRSRKFSRKRISNILVLQTHPNKSMVKVSLTPTEKDKERMASPRITNPIHQQRRVMGSRRRKMDSGVSSKKSLGTTLMNATPKNNFWLR